MMYRKNPEKFGTSPSSSVGSVRFWEREVMGLISGREIPVNKNGTSYSSLGTLTHGVELGLVDPVSG